MVALGPPGPGTPAAGSPAPGGFGRDRPDGSPAGTGSGVGGAGPASGAAGPAGQAQPASAALPSISLPTGGGAIRGIGETFTANPATGTGSMSVPIATSPGRSGFGPQLALSYDSGHGNGPFGFGWSLSLPSVTRKTDRGLPRYDDAAESDGFLISDAEDLVPVRAAGGSAGTEPPPGFRVDRYRPRVEGLFARIERWTRLADGDVHWRSITRDNVTTWYGEDAGSRIADPADPRRVFRWLASRSYDDKGNVLVYGYTADDSTGVDTTQAHERHRTDAARGTNRYLKRIRYGNRVSRLADPLAAPDWMFEVVFDYGDHDPEVPTPQPDRPWPVRSDPFSSYRGGFEVRTYRLCQRVLMFHHFPDEPEVGADCLVRSTGLGYRAGEAVGEFLTSVVQSGHRRDGDGYLTRSMPPLELDYSPATLHDQVRELDPDSLAGSPAGLAGAGYQWADLDGEGISGILAEQASTWFYKPNQGDGRFGPAQVVSPVPSVVGAGDTHPRLLDLAGDGRLDVVTLAGPTPGFFERRPRGQGWESFVPFGSLPAVDWDDPNLRFVDLDGDGHADVLLTEPDALTWYPSRAEAGFGPAVRVSVPADAERGPRLVFADGTGSVQLADMSGDGLTDLVRVRNGEVCYWPNLGYGRFGAKVVMDGAPWFDRAELFDPRFLRLADVDGSGPADLIYFRPDGARIYLNRSGNGWAPAHPVATAPRTDNRTQVATVDLLGTGTTCLVWSSDRPEDARRSLRYIDLLGSAKPHLLVRVANNLGAETHVRYASSTRFYLADRAAGRAWLTRLPFPVQVVERVTTLDRISRNRFVTRYAYHHGHFDGPEREFRGFGMVEQWDTEELTALGGEVDFEASNEDPASHVPPVLTKTWFHTGRFAGTGTSMSRQFETEYWREPGLTDQQQRVLLLADTHPPEVLRLPDGTAVPHRPTAEEVREACRALRGKVLRQEVYAIDGTEAQDRPYQVTESNYSIELLQAKRPGDRHAVCVAYPRERVVYHYERAVYDVPGVGVVADPRVSHQATLEVDGFGNVLRSVAAGYGRRHPDAGLDPALPAWARDAIQAEQARLWATLTVTGYTNAIDQDEHYRAPLPAESRGYELVDLPVPAAPARLSLDQLRELAEAASDGDHDLPFEDVEAAGATGPGPWRRLVDHTRTRYRRDDLTGPLPLGEAQPLGLVHETYQLAFTPGLVAQVYRRTVDGLEEELLPDPAAMLEAEGGYVADEEGWWVPSGRVFFSPDAEHDSAQEQAHARAHFYLPSRMRDPFGNVTTLTFDRYDLLSQESRDPLGNRVTVGERDPDGTAAGGHDYRVLRARLLTYPNRNRSEVAFDALGMVVGTAEMGKPGEEVGDSLDTFIADLPDATVAAHLVAPGPLDDPHAILGRATSRVAYDLLAYHRTRGDPRPQPAAVYTLARETHHAELAPGQRTRVQPSFSYSDGFGREIQRKVQAEPDASGAPRWVGSGWKVFNNKGKPVREYEPFFTGTHRFEAEAVAGVSPVNCYDPSGRVVATLAPDDTYAKVGFDPWQEASWDGSDTVLLDPRTDPDVRGFLEVQLARQEGWRTWHAQRQAGEFGDRARAAAAKTAVHAGTPSVIHTDPLGRAVVAVAHNRLEPDQEVVNEHHATRVILDVGGSERAVIEELGRLALRYRDDVRGKRIYRASMESGEHWMLADATGNPRYEWDSKGNRLRTTYDALRRPTGTALSRAGTPEILVSRTFYGESHGEAEARNLRGEVHQIFDTAGVLTYERYDFRGNPLTSSRQLAVDYRTDPDWSGDVALDARTYTSHTTYDALDRIVRTTAPDGTVIRRSYNEANLLERVEASLPDDGPPTTFVSDIDYNAKGQRTLIDYGNGVRTTYTYDPATFRLTRLRTVRGVERLQDYSYTYDPQGNPTHIRDQAQQAIFFRNQQVDPDAEYTYDATYRLIEATGREHLGQNGRPVPTSNTDLPRVGLPHPGDGNAVGRYHQRYVQDQAGNLRTVSHRGSDATQGWRRDYDYLEPSLLEPGQVSNRLTRTRTGQTEEAFTHDVHGNLSSMPHLPLMRWDHRDRLRATSMQVVASGTPETTWFAYDTDGDRVRKVTDRQASTGQPPARRAERIYLGDFEIHREYAGDGTSVTRERQTIQIADDEQRIALVETRTIGDATAPRQLRRFQLADHLGSSALELDSDAQILSYEEYYPNGGTSYQATHERVEVPKRYRYGGMERDHEHGLAYYGARYLATWLGRWISPDPLEEDEQDRTRDIPPPLRYGNRYEYCSGNPLAHTDPDGREPVDLYHFTGVKEAQGILKGGFKSGKSGFVFFTEKPSPTKAGAGAAAAKVRLGFKADVSIGAEISRAQWHQWYVDAQTQLKATTDLTGDALHRTADAIRNQSAQAHMQATGHDAYRIKVGKGQSFIAARTSALSSAKLKLFQVAGSGAKSVLLGKGIAEHVLAGRSSAAVTAAELAGVSEAASTRFGTAASLVKWVGRPLIAVAVAADVYEIYNSDLKARTVTSVVGGWTGAWLGAKGGSWLGAKIGGGIALGAGQAGPQAAAPEELVTVPVAGAIGGILGGIGGSIGGYFTGRKVTETVYDWVFDLGYSP